MKVFQFLLWFIFSNIWFTKKSYRTFCWEKNLEYSKITKIIYQQKNQNNVIVIMTPPPPTNKTETTNAGIIFYLHTTNSTSNLWKKEMFKSEFYSTVNLKRRKLCLNNKWNTSSFTVVCTTVAAHCSTHIHSRSDLSDLTGCAGWQLKKQKWASLFENPKNKKRIKKKIFPLMDFSLSKI